MAKSAGMLFHRLAHLSPEVGFLGQDLFAGDLLHGETSILLSRSDTVRLPIGSDKQTFFVKLKKGAVSILVAVRSGRV